MKEEKINEIGKELGVTYSDINKKTLSKGKYLPFYLLSQITGVIGSVGLSYNLGYSKKHDAYPFISYFIIGIPGGLFLSVIQTLNAYFSFSKPDRFGLSRKARISIFIPNILASFCSFLFLFMFAHRPDMTGVMYGVYSHKSNESTLN
ncbi:MAG: hypothetical protein ACXAC2_17490 [Candidatus Kariarchaeaceae archaeon]